jgi:hypothetical protein
MVGDRSVSQSVVDRGTVYGSTLYAPVSSCSFPADHDDGIQYAAKDDLAVLLLLCRLLMVYFPFVVLWSYVWI